MRSVVCFGDSNTWGSIPMATHTDRRRYGFDQRWTGRLQAILGADWRVIEEGLPGRTTLWDDPISGGHRSALTYLRPCLESHVPFDVLIVMLGTNDFKRRFGLSAAEVAIGLDRILGETRTVVQGRQLQPDILVVAPPAVIETGIFAEMFAGASAKSRALAPLLAEVARSNSAHFINADEQVASSPLDGIHLEPDAHTTLAEAVFTSISGLFAANSLTAADLQP